MSGIKSSFLRFGASLISSRPSESRNAKKPRDLFPPTDPTVDGDECLHDCETCTVSLPRGWKIEEGDALYGLVKGWQTHLVVATGQSDWLRDVEDEPGSLMQAVAGADTKPANGRLMLSASNMPTPAQHDPTQGHTALLLPAFEVLRGIHTADAGALIAHISNAPTNTAPLVPQPPRVTPFSCAPCPHDYLILLCSHRTRDARCGQSAPLLRREFERHLRPLGLFRDLDDERPGGVGVYFINHVGGHKYSANVMIYRSAKVAVANGETHAAEDGEGQAESKETAAETKEAVQCIWLARVRPEDCENIIRYTVLQGKVVKPERQLRGGYDRAKGLVSW